MAAFFQPSLRVLSRPTAIIATLLMCATRSIWCQVPEFFGIYAVVDNRLAALIGGKGTFTPSQVSLQIYDYQQMSTHDEKVIVLQGGQLRFEVFDAAAADTTAGLELYKMPFGRNLIMRADALGQVGGLLDQISGRKPARLSPPAPLQKYVIARTEALRVQLLQKPVAGQPQMIQLIPASDLESGLYCVFATLKKGGTASIVGQLVEWKSRTGASSPVCIDLTQTGGFGGMMEESDARMARPFFLAKENYIRCTGPDVIPPPISKQSAPPLSDPVPSPPIAPPPNAAQGDRSDYSVPGPVPTTPAGAVSIKTPMPPKTCRLSSDAGYVLILQNHSYSVRTIGSGASRRYVFFNENGIQAVDPDALSQLASAVWTHDNMVVSPDARSGLARVSNILATSQAMLKYTVAQDLLAYAMVDALEAAVTDGASLTATVTSITIGTAKSQLTASPKIVLTLAAQHGLEAAANLYRNTDGLLPPKEATTLNAADLARARNLYFEARSLELAFGALAAKLMPVIASDLTDEALQSALSAFADGPLFSGAPSGKITLQLLLDLQSGVANLRTSLPSLDHYSENLKLALNLTKTNLHLISEIAATAEKKCN